MKYPRITGMPVSTTTWPVFLFRPSPAPKTVWAKARGKPEKMKPLKSVIRLEGLVTLIGYRNPDMMMKSTPRWKLTCTCVFL